MKSKRVFSGILWGIVLVVGGVLFLLENLGIFEGGAVFWAAALGLGGLFFLSFFIANRENWWRLIPGIVLLAVAVMIALDAFLPRFTESLGGLIILGGIALSFTLVYLVNRENWWAIIPAGVLWTIAAITALTETLTDEQIGGLLFLGLGTTFVLVAILPNPNGRMRWPWIPAIILIAIGLLIVIAAGELVNYVWIGALILGGLYLIWRAIRGRNA